MDNSDYCTKCVRVNARIKSATGHILRQILRLDFSKKGEIDDVENEIDRKRPAMSAEPTEIKEIRLAYVRGVEGNSIYLNDHRIAGPKPWGGGDVLKEWKVDFKDIGNALPQIAQALAAQREGYEKRISELEDFQSFYKAELGHYHDLVNEHEQKIKSLTVAGEELAKVLKKYGSRQDISHEVGIVDSLARWEKEGG